MEVVNNSIDISFVTHENVENSTVIATAPYPDLTQILAVRLVVVVAYLLIMVFAVIGNAVVCCTVFTNRKMHTAVNYYIVNLAASDFMVGIFVLPVKLLELTAPAEWGILNDGLCTAMMYLQTIFVFASVLTLVAICIERYMAVLYPLESRMQQTKSRAKKIILVVWIIPCCVASPFLYPSEAHSNTLQSEYGIIRRLTCFITLPETFRRGYYTFLFIFIYILPLSFIAGTCFQVARCLLKDIPVNRQGSIRRPETNRRKVAKMVLMVVLAFAVCWTPYFLVSIVTQYQAVNFMERHNFFFTMLSINLLAFLNSCVNPLIYAAMSTRFRKGFYRFFRIVCLVGLWSSKETDDGDSNLSPSVTVSGRVEKHVRIRWQVPLSCFVAHSSSGSGSCGQSDASQRTACTIDQRSNSVLKSLTNKRSSQKIIVQFTKRNGQIKFSDKMQDMPFTRREQQKKFQVPTNFRKNFFSTGDLTVLHNASNSDSPTNDQKKCLSCLDIGSHNRENEFCFFLSMNMIN